MKKLAWIIPVNTALLFAILCFWSIQSHETVWAVIESIFCMLNIYFAYRWLNMRRTTKS